MRLEDYALIGDTQTAALVGRNGSVDWLCFPRFDSGACFAALLGDPANGRWLLAPEDPAARVVSRRYRPGTLVLETEWESAEGAVRVLDFMPPRGEAPDVVRLVEGLRGRVAMRSELIIRFDYGSVVPWVRRREGGIHAVAGPDALDLRTPVELRGENLTTIATFAVAAGDEVPFVLTWHPSHEPAPRHVDAARAARETERWWTDWSERCTYQGRWREAVLTSLMALKALTYAPTGGIVAAATTSLPEQLGGVRNWDYRYCWLRDATFTLYALMLGGYVDEARAWRDWLLRAAAGQPEAMQIMYGPAGERRLLEYEVPWLSGYEGARPVRVGNAAAEQFQLDVYGEVLDTFHVARGAGLEAHAAGLGLERALVAYLETAWKEPDEGIWEVRDQRRHFVHSKVMAWTGVDRAIKAVERFGLDGPVDRWRRLRSDIHEEVCRQGYDADRGTFVQSYGAEALDASLLLIPLVGFLPHDDPRARGTVAAIERELSHDGFIARYDTRLADDGLPPGEGVFLPCTFWLADNLALQGRQAEAEAIFERLLALRTDLGLLSEEYDVGEKRLVGNFPQAFTHVGLVNTARNLDPEGAPRPFERRR